MTDYSHLLPVREFPDRGTKWLLESPDNAKELVRLVAADLVEKLDFERIRQIPTTFIPDNLRKQEADILFLLPFVDGETEREVMVYILIEHQSTPSLSMGFRLGFYMFQIWDRQRREWIDTKIPESEWLFCPILPIVFFTGQEEWNPQLTVAALMDLPSEFEPFVPSHKSLFFNLKETAPEELLAGDPSFGAVLRVLQSETRTKAEFTEALMAAIEHLDRLPDEARAKWEKLMYYLVLLIYHRRDPSEREDLIQNVRDRVREHNRQEEVANMGHTIADALIQEGRELGVTEATLRTEQKVLINLLQTKFGQLPPRYVQRIQSIEEIERLDTLLSRFVTAKSLEEMEID